MTTVSGKPHQIGDLSVVIFDFAEVGDILPLHTHSEVTVHITIVAKGSFKASGVDWEQVAKAGDVLDFAPYQPHEFVSLEADSRIINIGKNVKLIMEQQLPFEAGK